jgi:flagellar biosynthesis protein FlhA
MPKIPFILVGGALLILGARLPSEQDVADRAEADAQAALPEAAPINPDAPEQLANDMRVEPLELEIAYDLIDLVDAAGRRPARLRRCAASLPVRRRDPARAHAANMELPQNTYSIRSRR